MQNYFSNLENIMIKEPNFWTQGYSEHFPAEVEPREIEPDRDMKLWIDSSYKQSWKL